jgi:tetratricopeptide (TPR) repeat protein
VSRGALAAAGALLLLAGLPAVSRAADEARVLRTRAEQLAAEDRCEEALERARRARALEPDDARSALVEGRCELRLGHYEQAVGPLEEARRLDPSLPGVSTDLAQCRFHLGELDAAERELDRAEAENPDDGRAALYRGLVLLERSEPRRGAEAFERAARLDTQSEPMASFYAGMAWDRAGEEARAIASLRRVLEESPGTPWAAEAERALARLEARGGRNWWAGATAGLEWDSNVVLLGTGVPAPAEITGQADGRGFWGLDAGVELLRDEDWSAGVLGTYAGRAQFDLTQFDLERPTASVWLDRRIDDASFARVKPFFGYTWLGYDPYVLTTGSNFSYHRRFGDWGAGRFLFRLTYNDFLFPLIAPPLTNPETINRDGFEYRVAYDHRLPVGASTILYGGLGWYFYDTQGNEYRHWGLGPWLGARQRLPLEFELDLLARYAYEPYQNRSVFAFPSSPVGARRDNIFALQVLLERPITRNVLGTIRYRFVNDASNTAVFNYSRNIIGGYVTVRFGG